jgi:hypothetical protein
MSSEDLMPRKGGAFNLITWCAYPTDTADLLDLLADTTDKELIHVADVVGNNPGAIAWAELAKRRGYWDFQISAVTAGGKLSIKFEAQAPRPIHDLPKYQ